MTGRALAADVRSILRENGFLEAAHYFDGGKMKIVGSGFVTTSLGKNDAGVALAMVCYYGESDRVDLKADAALILQDAGHVVRNAPAAMIVRERES